MNIFELRERLINHDSSYIRSFIRIREERIDGLVTSDHTVQNIQAAAEDLDGVSSRIYATAAGMDTPLTGAYVAAILRQTQADSLSEAILKVRAAI